MAHCALVRNALAWLVLLPGNIVCDAAGVAQEDSRDLLRMLVNSLVWGLVCAVGGALVLRWSGA